ncbi:MAG: nucleotide exchange factor GrpE [Acidimicrobiia bacterium]|nr:nucleotide exchange factor GrpE [Acidimicrobiia bacterium]
MNDERKNLEAHEREGLEDWTPGDAEELVTAEIVEDTPLHPDAVSPEALGLELPDDPEEARSMLLETLLAERVASGERLEALQRLAAEFENYRKRVARDHTETVDRAGQRVIEAVLPSLDNFDAALAYETQTPAEEKILDGLNGTYATLMNALGVEGLEVIEAAGKPFDPMYHEAVTGPVGGDGALVVAQELRRGYLFKSRVLRPTLVQVDHAGDDA